MLQSAHFLSEEEARRIFRGVDRDNDQRFTLEELKREANKYVAIETGVPWTLCTLLTLKNIENSFLPLKIVMLVRNHTMKVKKYILKKNKLALL